MSSRPFFGDVVDLDVGPDQVPTPVGEACLYCGHVIVEGDQGFMGPYLPGIGEAWQQPVHLTCELPAFGGGPTAL